jgi:hypothetical protein
MIYSIIAIISNVTSYRCTTSSQERKCGTCVMVLWHIVAVLREML